MFEFCPSPILARLARPNLGHWGNTQYGSDLRLHLSHFVLPQCGNAKRGTLACPCPPRLMGAGNALMLGNADDHYLGNRSLICRRKVHVSPWLSRFTP